MDSLKGFGHFNLFKCCFIRLRIRANRLNRWPKHLLLRQNWFEFKSWSLAVWVLTYCLVSRLWRRWAIKGDFLDINFFSFFQIILNLPKWLLQPSRWLLLPFSFWSSPRPITRLLYKLSQALFHLHHFIQVFFVRRHSSRLWKINLKHFYLWFGAFYSLILD